MRSNPILGHLLFWLVITALGTATIYPYYLDVGIAVMDRAFFLPVWWIATYLNWWVLMPRLLDTGKWSRYILILVVLIMILTVAQRYLCLFWLYPAFLWVNPPDPADLQPFLPGKFVQFGAFIALPVLCSIGIHLLMRWCRESYQARQILAHQQTAELHYLKAQINPHFLFNTLNSLYGLSLEGSPKVPGMILKLSDILSYSLYESSTDKISLYKEIKLIEDFISLEKERYADRIQVEFNLADDLDETLEIAPLLLIPFVENAFKHGVKEATEAGLISIFLGRENDYLIFEVKNKVNQEVVMPETEKKGVGLYNLKRRLELLYPRRHSMETKCEEARYCAQLRIQLDE